MTDRFGQGDARAGAGRLHVRQLDCNHSVRIPVAVRTVIQDFVADTS